MGQYSSLKTPTTSFFSSQMWIYHSQKKEFPQTGRHRPVPTFSRLLAAIKFLISELFFFLFLNLRWYIFRSLNIWYVYLHFTQFLSFFWKWSRMSLQISALHFVTLGYKWNTKHELLLSWERWDLLPSRRLGKNRPRWTQQHKVSCKHLHNIYMKTVTDACCIIILKCCILLQRVLQILGELNSPLPSKVVEDFTLTTHRNKVRDIFMGTMPTICSKFN